MGFFSDIAGAALSAFGQRDANQSSAQSIKDQMEFQAYMSNTSHQREVKDLIKAGLNPILSAKYGGASTPPGASMMYQNELGTSAIEAYKSTPQNQLTKAQASQAHSAKNVNDANTKLIEANTGKTQLEQGKILGEMQKIAADIDQTKADTEIKRAQVTAELVKSDFSKTQEGKKVIQALMYRQAMGFGPAMAAYGVKTGIEWLDKLLFDDYKEPGYTPYSKYGEGKKDPKMGNVKPAYRWKK